MVFTKISCQSDYGQVRQFIMGEQSSARLQGDDFQHLYSWFHILELLNSDAMINHIWVEHPDAGNVDDITVHLHPPDNKPDKYYQIKTHTDFRDSYSFEYFITPKKRETKSLLKRLFDSWSKLQTQQDEEIGKVEIWFVSNWNTNTKLGEQIRTIDGCLKDAFFNIKNVPYQKWKHHLQIEVHTFEEFCKSLRFEFGFNLDRFNRQVEDKMRSYGLKSDAAAVLIAIGIVRNWIKQGNQRKQITREVLLTAIDEFHLWLPGHEVKTNNVQAGSCQIYLTNLADSYPEWHIPNEMRRLIDWSISPVSIDQCIRLKRPESKALWVKDMDWEMDWTDHGSRSLSQALNQHRNVWIVGSSGSGKSTCLRYLCYHTSNNSIQKLEQGGHLEDIEVPILIRLREYGPNSFEKLIEAQLRYYSSSDHQLWSGYIGLNLILLLDGFDEIKPKKRDDFLNELIVWHQSYSNHRIIMTTRYQSERLDIGDLEVYELQPLSHDAIKSFAQNYVGHEHQTFIDSIEARGIESFIRIPLLLTFSLIIYKHEKTRLDSLAAIYEEILKLYKHHWENTVKQKRSEEPIKWDVLEESAMSLAYYMADDEKYSISRREALTVLQEVTSQLKDTYRWSYKHTIYDLLDQLIAHNLLESVGDGDEVGFWHSSLRDFFVARFLISLPLEQLLTQIQRDLPLVFAFVGGLLPDSRPIREALVHKSLYSKSLYDVEWPIKALSWMGTDTTSDILRAISIPKRGQRTFEEYYTYDKERFPELIERLYIQHFEAVHANAFFILWQRNFSGKDILWEISETLITLRGIEEGDIEPGDSNWFPVSLMNEDVFNSIHQSAVLAIADGDLDKARQQKEALERFFESLQQYTRVVEIEDKWLLSHNISGIEDFRRRLESDLFSVDQLRAFCQSTNFKSSLPYLEVILWFAKWLRFTDGHLNTLRKETDQAIRQLKCN